MSEYYEGPYTNRAIRVTDPETRPYIELTPYRTIASHNACDYRAPIGAILEFRASGRTIRGILRGYTFSDEGDPIIAYVDVIHSLERCAGEWGSHISYRVVQSPGPRARTLARGYCPKRPTGGASRLIDD